MKEEHVIESDVPMTVALKGSAPRSGLGKVLAAIGNGQSFLTSMNRATVYSLARYYGIRVSVQSQGNGQLRVWRIA